jgi:hypothetical protein
VVVERKFLVTLQLLAVQAAAVSVGVMVQEFGQPLMALLQPLDKETLVVLHLQPLRLTVVVAVVQEVQEVLLHLVALVVKVVTEQLLTAVGPLLLEQVILVVLMLAQAVVVHLPVVVPHLLFLVALKQVQVQELLQLPQEQILEQAVRVVA